MNYIAFDGHKRYTQALVEDEKGTKLCARRIDHERGQISRFLQEWQKGSPVALETIGNWYWIVDEIEAGGMEPHLTHARKAKLMMAMVNKSDRLDCQGLNTLQRTGTLPTVWIPPGRIRDARDLARTRMVLVQTRTRLKNRVHATLAKYGYSVEGTSDLFGKKGQAAVREVVENLPPHTRFSTEEVLEEIGMITDHITIIEKRMKEVFSPLEEMNLLMSMPGIGFILAVVIITEIGEISRFPSAEKLAAYAGTTPRIHQSGEHRYYGRVRPDVNRYLKWAYREASNVISRYHHQWKHRHVSVLYERVRSRKNHQVAIGAVSRHLAEATWWMLTKKEEYQDPMRKEKTVVSTKG